MATAAQSAKATVVVTKAELLELAEWEREYAKASKKIADAKKELEFRRLVLAEKVLGIKSADELKALTPEQITKKAAKRLENGEWEPGHGAPEFSFVKTNQGRYPAWSQLYAADLGFSAVARIKAETPVTYSYAVEVSVPA